MGRATERNSWKTSSISTRLRWLFSFAIALSISYCILPISNISDIVLRNKNILSPWNEIEYEINSNHSEQRFTIQTEGCSIPSLKPLSPDIKKFVQYPGSIKKCADPSMSLLSNNRTHVWINEHNKKYHNITSEDNLTCCYQPFYRPLSVKDVTSPYNDDRIKYEECKAFEKSIEAKDEFVRIVCTVNEILFYQQYFLFAFKKDAQGWHKFNNKTAYNVIIMGIDAVSRLNFHRTMPKTLAYLQNSGAVELLGYNKVGDNTFPNLVPMLMGISEKELKKTCMPRNKSFFDNCPLIWDWFKDEGYQTAFGEDSSSLGTFNYLKSGFLRRPTDYYIHNFIQEAEVNVGSNKDWNSHLCMNEKYFYKVLLDYIKDLFEALRSEKLFGFFWEVTMSHDYLNYPMLIDNDYEYFFKYLENGQFFNNTILMLVSDHGIRWGNIRSTKQGRLEERLPFTYILLPNSFREKYSEAYNNIKSNGKRLTTPYDIHATLTDLLDTRTLENDAIEKRKKQSYSHQRGISLFLPIPRNRTCSAAHIEDHWCTCHRSRTIVKSSIEAVEAAGHLVGKMNSLIRDYKECAQLKLTEIIEVNEMEVGSPDKGEVGWREYMVVVKTTPGEGIFEGTIRNNNREWLLEGSVSRLNQYGEQSRCMHNYQLKLYCYCN